MERKHLTWDSDFFGFKTGRVTSETLSEGALSAALASMRADGFRLVYYASGMPLKRNCAEFPGRLVDLKTTYTRGLDDVDPTRLPPRAADRFTDTMDYSQLEDLAVQSGALSRFAVDPDFPHEKFIALYKIWIANSISGKMADEVLVINRDGQMAGMVTLSAVEGVGSIGLIAVSPRFRGKKLGTQLMHDAHRYYLQHACHSAQVVTQGENAAACALYESAGYTVENRLYFYHFWL